MTHIRLPRILGGSFLVAGTAIGAGMLGLPIASGEGGFFPACAIYLVCWLFSLATGLLLTEVSLSLPTHANIISMSRKLLGPVGEFAAWILYIFLFYCLVVAYISGGGSFVNSVTHLPLFVSYLIFTGICGVVVYKGTKAVDRVNFVFMIGLILSYFVFLAIGISSVDPSRLFEGTPLKAIGALPIIFTSFSYQGIIPSLTTYFHHNGKAVRLAVIIGTTIPFIAYIIWQALILGLIPLTGDVSILATKAAGGMATEPLQKLFPHSPIYLIGQAFGAFAIITSFLGVALGLLDFLADGLSVNKTRLNKMWLCLLMFIPTLFIAYTNPNIFLKALGYAGGIGCALLLGLMPIMMAWRGRYHRGGIQEILLPGGKAMLIGLGAFILAELIVTLIVLA